MADDAALARIAVRQHRVVSLEELVAAGFSRNAIAYRIRHGRMRRLWRGVFLVGPGAPGTLSLAMGGVLTTAGDGVLTHAWAGWLLDFMPPPPRPIDVTVTRGSHRGRPGIRVHRTTALDPRDITRRKNIPVTSPARTCLDLAEVLTTSELERAVAEAQVKGLVRESDLHELIARSNGRRGVAKLAALLDSGPAFTRSELERLMLALVRAAGLPEPRTNFRLGRWEVDFYWPEIRLVVEVHGFAAHGHRRAFEKDNRKAAELTAGGYRVIPVTYRQLTEEPHYVVAQIAGALARAAA